MKIRRFVWKLPLILLAVTLAVSCVSQENNGPTAQGTALPLPIDIPTEQAARSTTITSEATLSPKPTDTSSPEPTVTQTSEPPTLEPTVTQEPTATAKPLPTDLALSTEDISIFPVPTVFAGDLVSIRIDPFIPDHLAPNDVDVKILLNDTVLLNSNINSRNLNSESYGLYQWVWDTSGEEGIHTLTAILDPNDAISAGDEIIENNTASLDFVVHSRSELTEIESSAAWVTSSNDCCNLHVVSGTAAHRDRDELLEIVDSAFAQASTMLDEPLQGPYDVFLIDRVIGQGGYASGSMVVSYLDRDYAGSGIYEVLVHEASHLMDRHFAPKRISFLSEGLAVWATGGHYRQENIDQKMAGLVEGGWYIPIEKVVNQIYSLQHELSYLEAASFLSYLIDAYGWERVREFYAATDADDGITLAKALEKNLELYFDRSLEEAEADWMAYLDRQPRDRSAVANLRSTIRYYNVMRHYQQQYDPTAYYLYAWLPSPEEAAENSATADLTRHPETAANITIETILISASRALDSGEFQLANAFLDTVERILESGGQFIDPLASSYYDIVRTADQGGFEIQEIHLSGDTARVVAVEEGEQELVTLQLELSDNSTWVLVN